MTERTCQRCGGALADDEARRCASCVEAVDYLVRLFTQHFEREEAEHARGAGAQAARGSSGEVPE